MILRRNEQMNEGMQFIYEFLKAGKKKGKTIM